jgi:hypothetical protein
MSVEFLARIRVNKIDTSSLPLATFSAPDAAKAGTREADAL